MLFIKQSTKLYTPWEQYIIFFENTVLFRITGPEGRYTLATATAGEDYEPIKAYSDQLGLLRASYEVFNALPEEGFFWLDGSGRLYLEVRGLRSLERAGEIAVNTFNVMLRESASTSTPQTHAV